MYVCDVGPFFQASLLTVIDPKGWADGTQVVTDLEFETIREGKAKRSTAILDEDMRLYNRLENVVLARVMHTLDNGFHGIGIHLPPSKWFGPGQAAQAWLKKENVPGRKELESVIPPWFAEAARMSYFGGWFEIFMHGIVEGNSHEYDINSAYPSVIARLPCLLHGSYSHGVGIPPRGSERSLTLVYASVWSPGMPDGGRDQHIGAMLHRDGHGRILRPMATEGWFWWDELQASQRAGLIKRLDNRGKQKVQRWVSYEPCDCPPPMSGIAGLYDKRLAVGKKSPLGKGAKLVYNSGYGKFAQSIGDPIFGNPVYASRITAGCRTRILEAIATHPKGTANACMVATDAVYFLDPHPGLPITPLLGEWEHKGRSNLTLFKPGVYWDDETRGEISAGNNPHFKARGFVARDFVRSIERIDDAFRSWGTLAQEGSLNGLPEQWPTVKFRPAFSMTTALQALRQHDWTRAGTVRTDIELEQNADPFTKREGLYQDTYDGRTIYRSRPHFNMIQPEHELEWVPSFPYEKRFGMDDPFSEEYKQQLGITQDGNVADILAWILTGE
jgi:hypothetical protein